MLLFPTASVNVLAATLMVADRLAVGVNVAVYTVLAVAYTHLTLPTKRIVYI